MAVSLVDVLKQCDSGGFISTTVHRKHTHAYAYREASRLCFPSPLAHIIAKTLHSKAATISSSVPLGKDEETRRIRQALTSNGQQKGVIQHHSVHINCKTADQKGTQGPQVTLL